MPFNLFALCKIQGNLEARKINLNQGLQNQVQQLFATQKQTFLANINQETEFQGDWKPDSDELLTIDTPADAQIIIDTINANRNGIEDVNLANFEEEPIKALFGQDNNGDILVQTFFKGQYLTRTFSIFLQNDTYNKLDAPAIAFDNKLLCIISNNTVKFKSFHNLRCLFDLGDLYKEATNTDLETFSELENIAISDFKSFQGTANQNIRKRIHNLLQSNVLTDYTANQIREKAVDEGLNDLININNNQIVMPDDSKGIMNLLSFLDEKLYRGPFSDNIIRANSTKVEGR